MTRVGAPLVLLVVIACAEAPRQDLRDQRSTGADVPLPGNDIGTSTPHPRIELVPGEPQVLLVIQVENIERGTLEIEREQSGLLPFLGRYPKLVHTQAFTGGLAEVALPADLGGSLSVCVTNKILGAKPLPHSEIVAATAPVPKLTEGTVRMRLVARSEPEPPGLH